MPSTIVPASLGLWAAAPDSFVGAMHAVPAGMLVNAGFLWVWRVLPPRLARYGPRWTLAGTLVGSLLLWAAAASASLLALSAVASAGALRALLPFGVAVLVGLVATSAPTPVRAGAGSVGALVLIARGALAAAAVGAAITASAASDGLLAGMMSVFPAIFLTTMVSLWWSRGGALPAAAVGPMMLGSCAVSAFAIVASWAVPALGPLVGVVVAWLSAVVGVSAPAAAWLARVRRVTA